MLRIISVKATLLLLICSPLTGQNLESIGKEKPLVIAGGVSLTGSTATKITEGMLLYRTVKEKQFMDTGLIPGKPVISGDGCAR